MTKKKTKKRPNAKRPQRTTGTDVGFFGLKYDAAKSDTLRRPTYYSTLPEDQELPPRERQIIISEARNALRNFTIAGFVLRKHLQNMAFYRFSARTPDDGFNRALEARVERWKARYNCDASERHNFDSLMGLIESHRAIDGDVGIVRLSNGKIQVIEGDRIRNSDKDNPLPEADGSRWVQGVRINRWGKAISYDLNERLPYGGFAHERYISAKNFDLLGYFTRIDQIRGVSLMAPAVRFFSQLYDSIDLALAKMRFEQAFGIAATFEEGSSLTGDDERDAERAEKFGRQAEDVFGPGVFSMILRPGEEAKFLESNNPSQNFQAFTETVIRMVFAAFDIPYSFYDGSKTNFYGSEGEFEQYIDSIEKKQQPTIEMLDEWVRDWLLPLWIVEGSITLPAGWTIDDATRDVGWRGAGLPSWRLLRNVKEILAAVQSGILPPTEVVDGYGYDLRRNLQDVAEVKRLAGELGIETIIGAQAATNVGL